MAPKTHGKDVYNVIDRESNRKPFNRRQSLQPCLKTENVMTPAAYTRFSENCFIGFAVDIQFRRLRIGFFRLLYAFRRTELPVHSKTTPSDKITKPTTTVATSTVDDRPSRLIPNPPATRISNPRKNSRYFRLCGTRCFLC